MFNICDTAVALAGILVSHGAEECGRGKSESYFSTSKECVMQAAYA